MAQQTTKFPAKTTTGTVRVGIQLTPEFPSSLISVVDDNDNVIATWDLAANNWSPLQGSTVGSDRIPVENFLQQNNQLLRQNTTKIINDLSPSQRTAFKEANSFKPYNDWLGNTETNNIEDGSPSSTGTVSNFRTDISSLSSTPNNITRNLIYPIDAITAKIDVIRFTPAELNLESGVVPFGGGGGQANITLPLNSNNNFGRRKFAEVSGGGSVQLGIQAPISDMNSVDWGSNSVDPFQILMYNAAMDGLKPGLNFTEGLEESITSLASGAKDLAKGMFENNSYQALFASMAAGNPGLFTRATSLAINPNMELLFNGPQLRPFNFSFILSGKEGSESATIKSIIKFFKYHMAPKVLNGPGLFLKTPHVFFIEYLNGKNDYTEHKSIGRVTTNSGKKACALTGFGVDYTPLGSYMTYKEDTSMVAYKLDMRFTEIVPIYDVDYENLPDNAIGY